MDNRQNYQPSKELQYFQKLIVQDKYIKYLNNACDYWEWENEKKETIIGLKENEIKSLEDTIEKLNHELTKVNNDFRMYVKGHKDFKRDKEKDTEQQAVISELKGQVTSLTARLQTRDRMMKLLEKQLKSK